MVGLVAVRAPVDGRDGRADVADLPEQRRGTEHDERDHSDQAIAQKRPEDPLVEVVELDLAKEDQDTVDDGCGPAERGEDHDEEDRDAERERGDGEDRADDEADDDDEEARVEAQPFEEADAQRVADRSAEDDDRGVVPEERDRREDETEDEPDPPRQDGREESLAEDVRAPLGAGDESEEECPEWQQDREQLEAVEGPGEADADRQQTDD